MKEKKERRKIRIKTRSREGTRWKTYSSKKTPIGTDNPCSFVISRITHIYTHTDTRKQRNKQTNNLIDGRSTKGAGFVPFFVPFESPTSETRDNAQRHEMSFLILYTSTKEIIRGMCWRINNVKSKRVNWLYL